MPTLLKVLVLIFCYILSFIIVSFWDESLVDTHNEDERRYSAIATITIPLWGWASPIVILALASIGIARAILTFFDFYISACKRAFK